MVRQKNLAKTERLTGASKLHKISEQQGLHRNFMQEFTSFSVSTRIKISNVIGSFSNPVKLTEIRPSDQPQRKIKP